MNERISETAAASFDPAVHGWKRWLRSGLEELIGDIWTRREGDAWAYGFIAARRHENNRCVVHGGVLMTFADHCAGLVAWEAIGRRPAATIQLNTHFMAAVRTGNFVEGRADIVRMTTSLVFLRGTFSVGETTVATMDGVWKRLRSE